MPESSGNGPARGVSGLRHEGLARFLGTVIASPDGRKEDER